MTQLIAGPVQIPPFGRNKPGLYCVIYQVRIPLTGLPSSTPTNRWSKPWYL